MGQVDITIAPSLWVALTSAVLFPFWLILTSRLSWCAQKHGLRFLIASILSVLFALVLVWCVPPWRPQGDGELAVAAALVCGALLFYLQVWGLLTRGYSLGILLTLLNEGCALTDSEISTRYRGGEGLQWIMRHRLGGLEGAGMIRRHGDQITLVGFPGAFVARVYGWCVAILGLGRTG